MINAPVAARPWLLLTIAAAASACTVPGNDSSGSAAAGPGSKVEEGTIACPTDGSSAIVFSGTAPTAVEGIGPGETTQQHEVTVPAGCSIESLSFRIEWDNEAEDLDLTLDYDGEQVGNSGAFNLVEGEAAEEITVSQPQPGVYTLNVNSYLNVDTPYMGSAEALAALDCQTAKGQPAEVESGLAAQLQAAGDEDLFEVIVAYHGSRPITNDQVEWLKGLGVTGTHFEYLPIAGLVANKHQVEAMRLNPEIRSIWPNAEIVREDLEARTLTSSDQAEAEPALNNADGLPYSGQGVTVLVNDSGIDATHPDLLYTSKTLANAFGHADLRCYTSVLPFHPPENTPHSDLLGSHGTHVAGIVAGNGTASLGKYRGAAPGATLAGYGTGAALLVLDGTGAFDYALRLMDTRPELNLRIVTNSFGTTADQGSRFNPNDPTAIATKELVDRDMVVVFSAGNQGSGPDSITGNYKKAPWVMIAGAANKDGLLGGYSSRGTLTEGTYEVQVGCETHTVTDRPNLITPGSDYISTRAQSADPVGHANYANDLSTLDVDPQFKPFYTQNTGTSMAAPHLAGLAAVLLEANPDLKWQDVLRILETTATNLPGFEPWQSGAGMANIEAALAMATGKRDDYGLNSHLLNPAKSRIELGASTKEEYQVDFVPVGERDTVEFEVPAGIALVSASWSMPTGSPCTCAVVITDPAGNRYGSGIALPLLAPRVSAIGPGMEGTWTLSVSGIGGVSGNDVDPLNVTNGYAGPETLDVTVEQIAEGQKFGLGDIAGHPDAGFIEKAVVERLIDGNGTGIAPNAPLTRGDFARYLMAWGVRQTLSHDGGNRFTDVTDAATRTAAEAVTAGGALVMDLNQDASPLVLVSGSRFEPGAQVTREQAAYALTQAVGREAIVAGHGDEVVAHDADGNEVPVVDADQIDPALKAHVQDAILRGVLPVRFSADGSQAFADPKGGMSRADYAVMAVHAFSLIEFDN